MPSPADLCSLNDAKAWLGINNTTSDTLLAGLITAVSRSILEYLNRSYLLPMQRTEVRDGSGTQRMMLKEFPVNSISSLMVDGSTIAACSSPPFGTGYILDAADPYPPGHIQRLTLTSQYFRRGFSNVTVVYSAGYQVTGEAWTVPGTPYQVTTLQPWGNWGSDQGVTYANGTALVKVASGPAVGQYSVSATGVYTFAAADAGAPVLISYGYVPADVRQACLQALGDEFKSRDRIGIQSKSLAGQETITYTSNMLTTRVKAMLASFVNVTPV